MDYDGAEPDLNFYQFFLNVKKNVKKLHSI